MKIIKLSLLFIIVTLFSCGYTYRDFQKVEDMQWFKKDVKKFEVKINKTGNYDLFFAMRYPMGYPYKNIRLRISQTSPDGKTMYKDANFDVIDEDNKYIGEGTGQLWDLEEVFSENQKLEKGEYLYEIEHNMISDPVITVIDIGLIIRKSD